MSEAVRTDGRRFRLWRHVPASQVVAGDSGDFAILGPVAPKALDRFAQPLPELARFRRGGMFDRRGRAIAPQRRLVKAL